jgi:dihydroxy-acid dehydratase
MASNKKENDKAKSDATKQHQRFKFDYGHRAIFKAMGFTTKELSQPRIAVVNSWGEGSPGHSHLRAIADGVKAGIRMAGGMPFEINVIGPCTMLGKTVQDAAHYDLPQREAILVSIESALHVGWCDGWVGIGSCDKIIPGMVLAALRLNRPFIFIGGGQNLPADYEGHRFGFVEGAGIMYQELQNVKSGITTQAAYERKLEELTNCCASSAGACAEMSTGNTMALLTEAMGFSLPGTSSSPAVSAEKIWQSKETGQKIVEIAAKGIRPSDIVSLNSLKNAIAIDMAACGGTNSLTHLQAYAYEVGVPCTLETWDEMSRKVPTLVGVAPSGPHVLYDFHKAGGVPVLMKHINKYLDETCLTVTGQSIGDNLSGVTPLESDVIRSLDNPIWPEGAKTILRGNLAPRGAVTRHTVIENKKMLKNTFTARVFNSVEEALEGVNTGKPVPIQPGDAVVVRHIGPRGGPAMPCCLGILWALKGRQIKDIAIITDGRFSGFTTSYLAIGHVCPEAQVGGLLAFIQDGDRIHVDIPNRRLDAEISESEIVRRKANWTPPTPPNLPGVANLYGRLALQADEGAGWPVRWEDFDKG